MTKQTLIIRVLVPIFLVFIAVGAGCGLYFGLVKNKILSTDKKSKIDVPTEEEIVLSPEDEALLASYEFLKDDDGYKILRTKETWAEEDDYVVPQTYMGEDIHTIEDGTFSGAKIKTLSASSTLKTIKGKAFAYCTSLESVSAPSVQTIGDACFFNCISLQTAEFSSTAKEYGNAVFACCESLGEFNFPDGLDEVPAQMFYGCTSLQQIDLPNGVKIVSDRAFAFSGLTQIAIPRSVDALRDGAFSSCSNLEVISFKSGSLLTYIGESAFEGSPITTIALSNKLQEIGANAFKNCLSLTQVIFPQSLELIGENAFTGCALSSISLVKNVTKIGDGAFSSCENLKTVSIEGKRDSDISFGSLVFDGSPVESVTANYRTVAKEYEVVSSTLKQITFGTNTAIISSRAFKGFPQLQTVTFLAYSDVTGNLNEDYDVLVIGKNAFESCTSLQSVVLPRVQIIDDYAFKGLTSITTFKILKVESLCEFWSSNTNLPTETIDGFSYLGSDQNPYVILTGAENKESITSFVGSSQTNAIDGEVFSGATNLVSVILPNSITSIGKSAFNGCTALTNFYAPKYVSYVGASAFNNCSSLIKNTYNNCSFLGTAYYAPIEAVDGDQITLENQSVHSIVGENPFTILLKYDYGTLAEGEEQELVDIVIPEKTSAICANAFKYTNSNSKYSIRSIEMPSVCFVGEYAFSSCQDLESVAGDNLKIVSSYAFAVCKKLSSFDLSSVWSLYRFAFNCCYELQNIGEFSKNLTSIEDSVFVGAKLKEITIPNTITYLGATSFGSCSSLERVSIGDGVTSIERSTFQACSSLSQIKVSDHVTKIGDGAFYGCTNLASFVFPKYLTTIGVNAFNSSGLKSVEISGDVSVGNYAFSGCSNLKSITINIPTISAQMFYNCSSLAKVTIGRNVQSILSDAFRGCNGLLMVTNYSTYLTITKGSTGNGSLGYYSVVVINNNVS